MPETRTAHKPAFMLRLSEKFKYEGKWHLVRTLEPLHASVLAPADDPYGEPSGAAVALPGRNDEIEFLLAD